MSHDGEAPLLLGHRQISGKGPSSRSIPFLELNSYLYLLIFDRMPCASPFIRSQTSAMASRFLRWN